MLNLAIQIIDNCQSLDELKAVWSDHAEDWRSFPVEDAAVILERKEARKRVFTLIRKWLMDSKILGRVPVVWDPKQPNEVVVNGVAYGQAEIKSLLGKELGADDLGNIHAVKRIFDGEVVKV